MSAAQIEPFEAFAKLATTYGLSSVARALIAATNADQRAFLGTVLHLLCRPAIRDLVANWNDDHTAADLLSLSDLLLAERCMLAAVPPIRGARAIGAQYRGDTTSKPVVSALAARTIEAEPADQTSFEAMRLWLLISAVECVSANSGCRT